MKKLHLAAFFLIAVAVFSCKKKDADPVIPIDTSKLEACDAQRTTAHMAKDWIGILAYNSELGKWCVSTYVEGTIDVVLNSFVCSEIPDKLKVTGTFVIYSGELKESNGITKPTRGYYGGDEFFYINLTNLKAR